MAIDMMKAFFPRLQDTTPADPYAHKYKSVKEIKAEAGVKKERKPVFICSGSKCFKKRVGRIIYGKEGEELFL